MFVRSESVDISLQYLKKILNVQENNVYTITIVIIINAHGAHAHSDTKIFTPILKIVLKDIMFMLIVL